MGDFIGDDHRGFDSDIPMDGSDNRPVKRRRFFVDDAAHGSGESAPPPSSPPVVDNDMNPPETSSLPRDCANLTTKKVEKPQPKAAQDGFDFHLFNAFIGHRVSDNVIAKIRRIAGNDVERAVNVYFDGSYKKKVKSAPPSSTPAAPQKATTPPVVETTAVENEAPVPEGQQSWRRYIGSFGVAAWSTKSGSDLVKHGEIVNIERTKIHPNKKRKGRGFAGQHKADVLTRFTNHRGDEIGRLPRGTAEWVSTLLDQKILAMEGFCVLAPDRIRVNDTIYLQLRCFLIRQAFAAHNVDEAQEKDNHRMFEEEETAEEKLLKQRQIALVKLFKETGLCPVSANEESARQKKEALLRAAELDEKEKKPAPSSSQRKEQAESSDSEEGEQLEGDQLDALYQKAQSFDFDTPEAQPGPDFILELRKYQKQALHWMLMKEKDSRPEQGPSMHPLWERYKWPTNDMDDKPLPIVDGRDSFYVNPYSGELSLEFPAQEQNCLGGILADEMGLGKTIEVMSLIHSNKLDEGQALDLIGSDSAVDWRARPVKPAPYTTLVVAPTSLLSQWESEALKSSRENTMKVLVYYGNDRDIDVGSSCMHADSAPNVIVTSYGVVRSDFTDSQSRGFPRGIFSASFFRVILDEAHLIKNRASKTARACYDLKSRHRWALTGTPIVNRLEDLYSLIRYLRVEPWSNFSFWKTFITVPFESKDIARALNVVQTVLEPLVLRRTKTMRTPDGEALVPLPSRTISIESVNLSEKEREIYDFIFSRAKQAFNENVAAGTLLKSYTTIFAQILRLRQACCHPLLTRNRDVVADEEDAAVKETSAYMDDMDLQDLINQFTTSCDVASNGKQDPSMRFSTNALKQIQNESSGECPICTDEPINDPVLTPCWHSACKGCLEGYVKHQTDRGEPPKCPSCREQFTSRDMFQVIRHNSSSDVPPPSDTMASSPPSSQAPRISLRRINPMSPSSQTSAKISTLISHLNSQPANTKAVVFSQFTSFLDLISPQLTREGIAHVRLDGATPPKQRASVISQFSGTEVNYEDEDEDTPNKPATAKEVPRVLIISLRAGGVGLNLTAANYVYMMDPWWSFAVEAQAIDRVHRMGQLREVEVTRFVVKDSIEERILRVQDRKMMIAGSLGLKVGGEGEEEKKTERIEELRLLFE